MNELGKEVAEHRDDVAEAPSSNTTSGGDDVFGTRLVPIGELEILLHHRLSVHLLAVVSHAGCLPEQHATHSDGANGEERYQNEDSYACAQNPGNVAETTHSAGDDHANDGAEHEKQHIPEKEAGCEAQIVANRQKPLRGNDELNPHQAEIQRAKHKKGTMCDRMNGVKKRPFRG